MRIEDDIVPNAVEGHVDDENPVISRIDQYMTNSTHLNSSISVGVWDKSTTQGGEVCEFWGCNTH